MPELFFLGAKLNENGSTDWHTQWRLLDTTGPCIICAYHHFTKLDIFHRVPDHPWILQILDGHPLCPRFWWGHASEKGWRFRFSWHPHSTGGRSVVRKETNTFRSWNVPRRKQSSVQIRESSSETTPCIEHLSRPKYWERRSLAGIWLVGGSHRGEARSACRPQATDELGIVKKREKFRGVEHRAPTEEWEEVREGGCHQVTVVTVRRLGWGVSDGHPSVSGSSIGDNKVMWSRRAVEWTTASFMAGYSKSEWERPALRK